jgi:hypothetical protein
VVWLAVNGVRSAIEIYDEQRDEIDRLNTAFEDSNRKTSTAGQITRDQLIALRKRGYELRNKQIQTDEVTELVAEINEWTKEVSATLKSGGGTAQDISRFEVIGNLSPVAFQWAKTRAHQKRLQKLEDQLKVLLELMAKF